MSADSPGVAVALVRRLGSVRRVVYRDAQAVPATGHRERDALGDRASGELHCVGHEFARYQSGVVVRMSGTQDLAQGDAGQSWRARLAAEGQTEDVRTLVVSH
jgi:hypothetical protein